MRRHRWYALLLVVLIAALAIGLGIGLWLGLDGDHSEWPGAVAMMKILPADAGEFNYYDFSTRPTGWWEGGEWEEHYGTTFMGQSWGNVYGMAMLDEPHIMWLLEGDLDLSGMRSALGTANGETYEYGGTTVWKGEYYSTAIVNQIVVTGEDAQVQRCIDAASGKLPSLYDDRNFKWVADSLPKGTSLAVFAHTWGNDPNLIVQGVARDDREGYNTEADAYVYDYEDVEYATTRVEEMTTAREKAKAEGAASSDFKIEQDGQYVMLITFPLV